MKKQPGQISGCSGFTIIELMVTCAIIVILGSISIAGFSAWLPNYRLKSAARDLYSSMQQAKLSAIKQQGVCTITYSSTQYDVTGVTKTVILSDYGSGVRFGGPSAFATPSPPYDPAIITFNSRGMCTGLAADAYAYLSNEKQTAHYRVGTTITGGIRLERWNAETNLFEN